MFFHLADILTAEKRRKSPTLIFLVFIQRRMNNDYVRRLIVRTVSEIDGERLFVGDFFLHISNRNRKCIRSQRRFALLLRRRHRGRLRWIQQQEHQWMTIKSGGECVNLHLTLYPFAILLGISNATVHSFYHFYLKPLFPFPVFLIVNRFC